ncbi:MAG TPA: serine/threonine-protein kinase [Planctomycetota bacterium]|mgnify:FL=1|nr:serine/threonine-protein kinase [Planctomycetota bacterium]HRR79868.1 serine/threonine-protein kinase [Planctomycetota bacterium]
MALLHLSADLYRVEAVIWTGETAEICRAMAPDGSIVAIKRLRADKLREWSAVGSLRREANMGSRFEHPNVIQILDFAPGPPYPIIVMEYFPSRNLKVRVLDRKGDPLLGARCHDVLLQMASALAHVHERGIIHMDIKPENFLATDDGVVKLTDFALATPAPKSWHRFLPRLRRIAGTRPYIAPETILRKRPDFRTDIYSFGATLFEVLARRPPFISTNRDELLNMHLREPAPWPWTFNKNLTREINDLIVAMLQKSPDRRPSSMFEVLTRLKRLNVYEKPPEET